MRRTTRFRRAVVGLLLGATALLLGGCWILSLHPLHSDDHLVFEPGLEGVWGDPENPEDGSWQFVGSGGSSYRLVIREGNELLVDPARHGIFEAHLVRLGDGLFLDLFPETPEYVSEYYESHVIPAHSFGRLALEGHVLRLALLDADWLKERLRDGEIRLPHEQRGDDLILTASTEELQAFVLAHATEAFDEEDVLYRLQ